MGARLAAIGGYVLRAVFAVLLLLRRPRPIHPHGVVLEGELTRTGAPPPSGIPWIDDRTPAGAVTARLSRSAGLPAWLPDVLGLALRLDGPTGTADLELATTGFGVPGRFLLSPHRRPSGVTFGTLLPYRSRRGPVLICARSAPTPALPASLADQLRSLQRTPWRLRLYFAAPTGRWHRFADLRLHARQDQDDRDLRFDADRNTVAASYRWVRRLRQPSYRLVQSTDGAPPRPGT